MNRGEISEAGKAGRQKPSKEQTETRWGRKQSGLPGQRRDRHVKNREIDLKNIGGESGLEFKQAGRVCVTLGFMYWGNQADEWDTGILHCLEVVATCHKTLTLSNKTGLGLGLGLVRNYSAYTYKPPKSTFVK